MSSTNFKDLLCRLKNDKTRVLINGLGSGTTKGTIIEVNDDYIAYELLDIKEEKTKQKTRNIREIKYIPIADIHDISEGQKETDGSQSLGKLQAQNK